ncbi:MAG: DUF4364 family protein [Clostridia bacterium]|nr:DUF4364 family protein [Clostridia bacterium]
MNYFSDGSTKDKLILLSFLDALNLEVTKEQITTACAQYDLIPYFELQNALYELEEEGFLATVPRPFGMAYCILQKGKDTISAFSETLPLSERENIADNADMCRAQFRNETQYTHRIDKLPSGAYKVVLRAIEAHGELFSVSLSFASSRDANSACKKWAESANEIYSALNAFLS